MSDLATIEDRLRRTYQAVAETTVVTRDELPDPSTFHEIDLRGRAGGHDFDLVELSDHRGPGRRRLLLTAAATAVVVALGAAAVVVGGGGTDEPTAQTGGVFTPGWTTLPEAPISARYAHSTVWTGTEMLVFGGYDDSNDTGQSAEGAAAYAPDTNSWRTIAEPPDHLRGSALTVWTGDVVVALPQPFEVGTGDAEKPGAIYDPEDDAWHEISPSGVGLLSTGSQAFWTGDRVLVAGMFDSNSETWVTDRAALYDPATDTWERLPDAPVLLGQAFGRPSPEAVWTGEEMIYVGVAIEDPDDFAIGNVDLPSDRMAALALDPETKEWRELPDVPLSARFSPGVAWTGSHLVVAGGLVPDGGGSDGGDTPQMDAAIFDPDSETWERLPDMPVHLWPGDGGDTGSASLAARHLVFFGGGERPLLFDTTTRTWSLGEPNPDGVVDPEPGSHGTVSIGDTVLRWGGQDMDTYESTAAGYAYTPG